MSIHKISATAFPELKRSVVYQVVQKGLTQGEYVIAIDPELETANVYCRDKRGAPLPIDYSNLYLKTLADVRITESEVLSLHGRENIYQAVRDWSESDYAALMDALGWDTAGLAYDDSLAVALKELAQNVDYRYLVDPYSEEASQVIADLASTGVADGMGDGMGDEGPLPDPDVTNAEDEFGDDLGPMPDLGGGDGND